MLQTKGEIINWLEKYGVYNFDITDDLIVNVSNELDLSYKKLTEIPIQFGIIHGMFDCSNNQLTKLPMCKEVKKALWAHNNQIVSLEDFPIIKGVNTRLENNKITSLKGLPEEINGNLYLENNQLTSLEYGPKIINGDLDISSNPLKSLKGITNKIEGDLICFNIPLNILQEKSDELNFLKGELICDISNDINNELMSFYKESLGKSSNDGSKQIYISLEELRKYKLKNKMAILLEEKNLTIKHKI